MSNEGRKREGGESEKEREREREGATERDGKVIRRNPVALTVFMQRAHAIACMRVYDK